MWRPPRVIQTPISISYAPKALEAAGAASAGDDLGLLTEADDDAEATADTGAAGGASVESQKVKTNQREGRHDGRRWLVGIYSIAGVSMELLVFPSASRQGTCF